MPDTAVLAAPGSPPVTASRRLVRRGFGVGSFVISTFAWVSYQFMFVAVALLVVLAPGLATLVVELTEVAGLRFDTPVEAFLALFVGAVGVMGALFVVAVIVFNCAMVTSVTSIVLGVIALVRGDRRTLPVTGIVMSVPILAVNALVYLWYADVI